MQVAELLGKNAANDGPVLERITRTGGRLRAVGNHPPAAVGRAREIGGVEVQVGVAGWLDPWHGQRKLL
jgi:hypothetical protein